MNIPADIREALHHVTAGLKAAEPSRRGDYLRFIDSLLDAVLVRRGR